MQSDLESEIQFARQHNVGDILRRSAMRFPDKTAIICGQTEWTYKAFDTACNQLARHLLARGISAGDKIAVVARNSHGFAAIRFAIARIGAVLVPINFMLNANEVRYILNSSRSKMLALGPEFIDIGLEAISKGTDIEITLGLPSEHQSSSLKTDLRFEGLLTGDATAPEIHLDDRSLAQIVYTSGTEAMPKGAMLSHSAVLWQYTSCIIDGEMTTSDVMLHALPLYHCAQLDVFLGPAVYLGMTSTITSEPSPDNILALLEKREISSFFAPPSVWISLLRSPLFDKTNFQKLEKGYYGASIMPVEILACLLYTSDAADE